MARWLCRLTVEELRQPENQFSLADSLSVGGWVLCGLTIQDLLEGPETWLSFLPEGAGFVLEIGEDGIGFQESAPVEAALRAWLSHPQAVRWSCLLYTSPSPRDSV